MAALLVARERVRDIRAHLKTIQSYLTTFHVRTLRQNLMYAIAAYNRLASRAPPPVEFEWLTEDDEDLFLALHATLFITRQIGFDKSVLDCRHEFLGQEVVCDCPRSNDRLIPLANGFAVSCATWCFQGYRHIKNNSRVDYVLVTRSKKDAKIICRHEMHKNDTVTPLPCDCPRNGAQCLIAYRLRTVPPRTGYNVSRSTRSLHPIIINPDTPDLPAV